jgi:hypothetical protein
MRETKESTKRAIETLVNGNISDFKKWLLRAHKVDILDAIEYHQNFGARHVIINKMRYYLSKEE